MVFWLALKSSVFFGSDFIGFEDFQYDTDTFFCLIYFVFLNGNPIAINHE